MKLYTLDVPDDSDELVAWLERHLVGHELRALVAELSVVVDESSTSPTLDEVLGESIENVLRDGLSAADSKSVPILLKTPTLLFELQERVFVDGRPYWDDLVHRETSTHGIKHSWQKLHVEIQVGQTRLATARSSTSEGDAPGRRGPRSPIPRVIGALLAASLLIGVFTFLFKPPNATGWGFNHPDAMRNELPPNDYLRHLATSATQWNNKRPESREDVEKRIRQFIAGCDTLIAAEHNPLSRADRDWLVERCKAWRSTLANYVTDLDTGAIPLDVRTAADQTVDRLIKALRKRADEINSS